MAKKQQRGAEKMSTDTRGSQTSYEPVLGILGAIFGLIGAVLAIFSYVQSQKSLELARESEKRSARAEELGRHLEVEQYLADAWDLMGGDAGTTSIQRPTSDENKLELARRLIVNKALVLQPDSAKAHRYYAVYLYAHRDLKGAVRELERALRLDPTSPEAKYDLTRVNLELHGVPRLP